MTVRELKAVLEKANDLGDVEIAIRTPTQRHAVCYGSAFSPEWHGANNTEHGTFRLYVSLDDGQSVHTRKVTQV